jgi:hypothetical protein
MGYSDGDEGGRVDAEATEVREQFNDLAERGSRPSGIVCDQVSLAAELALALGSISVDGWEGVKVKAKSQEYANGKWQKGSTSTNIFMFLPASDAPNHDAHRVQYKKKQFKRVLGLCFASASQPNSGTST